MNDELKSRRKNMTSAMVVAGAAVGGTTPGNSRASVGQRCRLSLVLPLVVVRGKEICLSLVLAQRQGSSGARAGRIHTCISTSVGTC